MTIETKRLMALSLGTFSMGMVTAGMVMLV